MRNVGRTLLSFLALASMLLVTWSSAAFAATVSPEIAAKVQRVRDQMNQKITDAQRAAAAESLKALREQVDAAKKAVAASNTTTSGGLQSIFAAGTAGVDFALPPVGPNEFLPNGQPKPPDYFTTANWAFTPPIAKFVDTVSQLSGVDASGNCVKANDLGQCLPVAVPDTVTYPGADYYEISLREWHEVMHTELPLGTPNRGYIQTNDGTAAGSTNCTNPNALGDPNFNASDNTCNTVAPPNKGHFLGPIIIAQRDRPVRIKFTNELPADLDGLPDAHGHRDGDLFIPVDETVMGAGAGFSYPTGQRGVVSQTQCDRTDPLDNSCEFFSQNRATVHLHGGRTPWISDGTPHQWITPKDENTPYPQGVSVAMVPDMPNPGDGSMTFYYTNQQTARLMFYHDHAFGITRLNVLAGMFAGYVIQDAYEKDLTDRNIIPGDQPDEMIALVMEDRTFVDATPVPNPRNNNVLTPRIRLTDPLWNWGTGSWAADGVTRNPKTGDLWLPHVYMPAQNPQNPDGSGANPFGRWMYGPWFYPPTVITHPPIANPYYDPDCASTNQWVLADCQTPGQPPLMPATPHPSMGMEAFFDSWVVNGTVFPRLEVEPKAYRFRILNAANDRALNMSIYKADNTPANMSPVVPGGTLPFSGKPVPAGFDPKTEVKMVPASATAGWPADWPVDGRDGGVPDPGTYDAATGRWSNWGPSWVQIGTDAGFLPQPDVRDPQPITYRIDPTAFWVGNVYKTGLALMPAERADVIVDFSKYAGQTLIVYNDAPAAWPAGVANYDYWTGAPDFRDSGGYGAGGTFNAVTGLYDGGHGPLPGFAPNTRTVLQIKVKPAGSVTTPSVLNMDALNAEFSSTAPVTTLNPDGKSLFERAMEPAIVAQSAYDEAYGKTFPTNAPWRGVRDRMDDGHIFNFQTIDDQQVSVLMKPKGIHDEMGASFDAEYGRMSGNLAIEIQPPQTNNANLNLYSYSDVPTEIVQNSTTPKVQVDVLGQLADGTQIWNVSHNGVDTHPIHFHIFDVQVINRLGWDNLIEMPLPNEIGWKDTVRISPLEDTIVAVRPVAPALPFGVPNSIRPLNPAIPIGSQMGFSSVDPVTGQAYVAPSIWAPGGDPNWPNATGVHNILWDFGWEYVWHCHILSHEEMDMMRPIILQVDTLAADNFTLTDNGGGSLSWTDPTPIDYTNYPDYLTGTFGTFGNAQNEIGFNVWRSGNNGTGAWTRVGSTLANHLTFADAGNTLGDTYVVEAYNAGWSTYSNSLGPVTLTVTPGAASFTTAPQDFTLQTAIGAPLNANTIDRVDYYDGTTLIGSVPGTDGAPYTFNWTGVQTGSYSVTAQVVALGAPTGAELYAVSAPHAITIGGSTLTPSFTINLQTPPANIGVCDALILQPGDPGGTAPYTYTWVVNGVTYTNLTVPAVIPALPGSVAGTSYDVTMHITDSTGLAASLTQQVTVTNTPPTAAANGPYNAPFGGNVTLAGSGGVGVDSCETVTSYAWDLDGDGVYDYSSPTLSLANRTLKYSLLQPWLAAVGTLHNGTGPGYDITFKVRDSNGASTTSTAVLTLGPPPYAIATTALTPGTVGTAYSLTLAVNGAAGATTWEAFGLPDGLTLDPATGIISGTPTAANIRTGRSLANFPVSIINVDATGARYTSTVLFLKISL